MKFKKLIYDIDALKYTSILIKLFNRFLTEIEIRITK